MNYPSVLERDPPTLPRMKVIYTTEGVAGFLCIDEYGQVWGCGEVSDGQMYWQQYSRVDGDRRREADFAQAERAHRI